MTVTYDSSQKKWTFTAKNELPLNKVSYPPAQYYINISYEWKNADTSGDLPDYQQVVTGVSFSTTPGTNDSKNMSVALPLANSTENIEKIKNNFYNSLPYSTKIENKLKSLGDDLLEKFNAAANNEKINNEIIAPYNNEVKKYNQALPVAKATINATKGGDYVTQREALKKLGISGLEDNFKAFYLTEKLTPWDVNLGSKPQYGNFDPGYYKAQNPTLAQKYSEAVANDDVDIVNRYGENGYYLWHYTTQGKPAGLRGNAPEATAQANQYVEKKPTDKDIQDVRKLQLGINTDTTTERLLNIDEVNAEWEKAKAGDPYWSSLAKEKYLDPKNADEFAALFRLSNRDSDKQIKLNYNVNTGYGVTDLEEALNQAVGEKATVDVKRFGALAQNVLKDTIDEMKKAKAKEQTLEMLSGFGGLSEIMNINDTIANSILGDSGVGGMLSYTAGNKPAESLTKQLENITGVKNNVTYNWQNWFDNTIKEKYSKDLELGYSTGDVNEKIKIDAEFAKNFIDTYLKPRFDTSRSMDEFKEYLDVRQEEKNPFQTQDMLDAVSSLATLRANKYLSDIQQLDDRYFDPAFYFDPTGNTARTEDYALQKQTVADDWEKAKAGDAYWAQQAYRFGVDVNDKAAFAKMHYQVKGLGKNFDAAKDILTAGAVNEEIYTKILPALKEEALKQGTVFGQFITPEEFADSMLKGLDPNDTQAYAEVLKKFGLSGFKGTTEELKAYITEVLRTSSAQQIRENIKYLNEKNQTPTQKNLGLFYIERPEDAVNKTKAETELYATFKSSGYKGSEDEFYNEFFPDLDRSEQQLIGKTSSGKLSLSSIDLNDPFAALSKLEDFSGTTDKEDTSTTKSTSSSSSYFNIGLDDEEDTSYKSKTGSEILGEFTSLLKGF